MFYWLEDPEIEKLKGILDCTLDKRVLTLPPELDAKAENGKEPEAGGDLFKP